MNVDYYRDLIRPVFRDKKIILATGVIAGMAKGIDTLEELGAAGCLLVGAGEGTGEVPDPDEVPWVVAIDESPPDFLTGIRNYEAALRAPLPRVVEAVETFDPEGEALVLCAHVSDLDSLLGRPRLGARQPAWAALEDKVVIDAFWTRAGVECAPVEIVDVADFESCQRASKRLDRGAGAVWAGDAKEGFNGGARYVRHIRQAADMSKAHEFFVDHCDSIRVMPFLDGVPCSIHGMVFSDQTIAFRPVEMIVFRRPDEPTFFYAGTSTWWDPDDEVREVMRRVARKVGDQLRDEVDYRGAFTVDGVVTSRGFLPTELNARSGGAFGDLYAGDRRLPLTLIDRCVRHGIELDYRPAELEALVLEIADGHRHGGGRSVVDRVFESTETHKLILEPEVRLATEGEEAEATLTVGPSDVGGFIRAVPARDHLDEGTLLAPIIGPIFAFADDHFDSDIGPLIAPQLRTAVAGHRKEHHVQQ